MLINERSEKIYMQIQLHVMLVVVMKKIMSGNAIAANGKVNFSQRCIGILIFAELEECLVRGSSSCSVTV